MPNAQWLSCPSALSAQRSLFFGLPVSSNISASFISQLLVCEVFSQYLSDARRDCALRWHVKVSFFFPNLTVGGDVYEEQRCWLEVFQQAHMNRLKLMVQNEWDILLFSVGTIQVWQICARRPTIRRCLYDGSNNCVSSVTFLYFSSSKTSTVWFIILFANLLFACPTVGRFFRALFTQKSAGYDPWWL